MKKLKYIGGARTMIFIGSLGVSQSEAALVLVPLSDYQLGSGGQEIVRTVTAEEIAGYNQIVVSYTVWRDESSGGDSWMAFRANPGVESVDGTMALLLRMMVDIGAGVDNHQVFGLSSVTNVGGTQAQGLASPDYASSVRITMNLTNAFSGAAGVLFEIDENSTSFSSANISFSGTINSWGADTSQAIFALRAHGKDQEVTGFTMIAVPEPSLGLYSLISLGMLAFHRRRRRVR